MADPENIARIKRNLQKMIDSGAPEPELDQYLKIEGVTPDDLRGSAGTSVPGASPAPTETPSPATGTSPSDRSWTDYTGNEGVMGGIGRGMDAFGDATEGLKQGLTFGAADEIAAGAMTPIEMMVRGFQGKGFSPSEAFNAVLEQQQRIKNKAAERSPVANTVGNVIGSVVGAGKAMKFLPSARVAAAGAPSRVGMAVGEGAALGGIEGGLSADENRMDAAKTGALLGGATAGLIEGTVGSRAVSKAVEKETISSPELAKRVQDRYAVAKDAELWRPSFHKMLDDSVRNATVTTSGGKVIMDINSVSKASHPRTHEAIQFMVNQRIPNRGTRSMTLEQAQEIVNHVTKDILPRSNGADRDMLSAISTRLIRNMNKLSDKDFITANGGRAVEMLKQTFPLGDRRRKAKLMESVDRRISKISGPKGQAIRAEMDKLMKSPDYDRFTPEEKRVIEKIAKGSISHKVLDSLAAISPGNMKGFMFNALLSFHNPAVALTLGGVGGAAAKSSSHGYSKTTKELKRMVSTGTSRKDFYKRIKPKLAPRAAAVLAAQMGVEDEDRR